MTATPPGPNGRDPFPHYQPDRDTTEPDDDVPPVTVAECLCLALAVPFLSLVLWRLWCTFG